MGDQRCGVLTHGSTRVRAIIQPQITVELEWLHSYRLPKCFLLRGATALPMSHHNHQYTLLTLQMSLFIYQRRCSRMLGRQQEPVELPYFCFYSLYRVQCTTPASCELTCSNVLQQRNAVSRTLEHCKCRETCRCRLGCIHATWIYGQLREWARINCRLINSTEVC